MKEKKHTKRKPRGFDPEDIKNNFFLASQDEIKGPPVSWEAMSFFSNCLLAMGDNEVASTPIAELKKHGFGSEDAESASAFFESNLRLLGIQVFEAFNEKNANFFKEIAQLCEFADRSGKLSLRSWILRICFQGGSIEKPKQTHFFSAKDLCGLVLAMGYGKIEQRRMHEICNGIGVKLLKIQGKRDPLRRISN